MINDEMKLLYGDIIMFDNLIKLWLYVSQQVVIVNIDSPQYYLYYGICLYYFGCQDWSKIYNEKHFERFKAR